MMTEWVWVAAGYGVVYAAMAAYVAALVRRERRVARTAAHPTGPRARETASEPEESR